jgi:phage gpG-like protein
MIKMEIDDREVLQALQELGRRTSNMKPVLHTIGQALMEGSRERILSGRDWTGQPFAPNTESTLLKVMRRAVGGKGLRTKRGNTKAAAVKAVANKNPLIDRGDFVTKRLYYRADRYSVVVGASAIQAAVLQFGAKKGAFGATKRGVPIPFGDIPARRYLPITREGALDPAAQVLILDAIRAYLADGQ